MGSALARPGLTLVLRGDSRPGRRFGLCGIDPQNLLQVDSTVLLHTRWVRACAGGFTAEFTTAAVQDAGAGTFTAVVGPEDSVRLTAGGHPVTLADGRTLPVRDLTLRAPRATLDATHAVIRGPGDVLRGAPGGG